jgi:hypothetical protein
MLGVTTLDHSPEHRAAATLSLSSSTHLITHLRPRRRVNSDLISTCNIALETRQNLAAK